MLDMEMGKEEGHRERQVIVSAVPSQDGSPEHTRKEKIARGLAFIYTLLALYVGILYRNRH